MKSSFVQDDKVSILDDAIEYLKKLEKRIRELEASKELVDIENRTKRATQDMVERTSDNYCDNGNGNGKKPMSNKRKVRHIDERSGEIDSLAAKDSSMINVNMSNNEVVIEMKCPWSERAMLDIMEAANGLQLDFDTVQSSTADGNLYLTMKAKVCN